jgi:hypothetical protein
MAPLKMGGLPDEAARRGFLENGTFPQPIWASQKMRRLKDALREMDGFAIREKEALGEIADLEEDVLIEPFSQDFWEMHYF